MSILKKNKIKRFNKIYFVDNLNLTPDICALTIPTSISYNYKVSRELVHIPTTIGSISEIFPVPTNQHYNLQKSVARSRLRCIQKKIFWVSNNALYEH